jgi:aminoglycoside phosphotransferase (APT) family kinase protein
LVERSRVVERSSASDLAAPVAALLEVGVLDEVGAELARVDDLSRAHPVWRVGLADGRRLVVKAGLGHGGPDLAVECLVYRMTWWCEPLAAALPVPLVVDEDRQLLVLADVGEPDGTGSLAQQEGFPALLGGGHPGTAVPDSTGSPATTRALRRTVGALGRSVGTLHRATAGFPLPPAPPPLVLALVGRAAQPPEAATLSPVVRATLAALDARPLITDAVARLRRPVGGCLVNHDLKWDNVVLTGPTRQPVLLDWELAGLGDPAWDLGCLLGEHLVRDERLDDVGRALLSGYRDGARLRAEIVATFARRVVLAAGLRIVQLALEVAYTPYAGDGEAVARLTERAETVLAATTPLTEEVIACLS